MACVAQGLKVASYEFGKWRLHSIEREAIDNICTKIARIVCRKSDDDLDSWQGIAGYATLVVNYIKEEQEEAK